MENIVCIKNKADIGVVRTVSFGGMQFAVKPPIGALDPQPSARLAAEMVASREFCYYGHEDEEERRARALNVRLGPPTLEELRARAQLEQPTNPVEASGPLKRVVELGQAQAKSVIEGQLRVSETIQKYLRSHTPPDFRELRATLEKEAAAAKSKDEPSSPVTTQFSEEIDRDAAILNALADMTSVVGDLVEPSETQPEPADLQSLSETDLRRMARDAGLAGWREASRAKLIKMLRK